MNYGKSWGWLSLLMVLIASCWLALMPEKPATLLTKGGEWQVLAPASTKVPLSAFPSQFQHFRTSVVRHHEGVIYRTWTPDQGVVPIQVRSGLFLCWRYLSIAITGTNQTPSGKIQCFLERMDTLERIEVFRGGVNVNGAESLLAPPRSWVGKPVRLVLDSTEADINVGAGSVFGIGAISYAKSSFFGRLPYFVAAFLIFSLIAVMSVALVHVLDWELDPFPAALAGLGLGSLGMFYLSSALYGALMQADWANLPARFAQMGWCSTGIAASLLGFVLLFILVQAGTRPVRSALRSLGPHLKVWFLVATCYFALSGLTFNGNAHWEPNYRFWPAAWSSDNELPWMFAEALRQGFPLKGLFGGGWLPTDRPPLMAGAHLLFAQMYRLLSWNNDGDYLLGPAYNAAAVLLNTLWAPTLLWFIRKLQPKTPNAQPYLVMLFVGALPFVVFNSIYGWPKFFGAAFALAAFGQAWLSREPGRESSSKELMCFFLLSALSMLAHESTALFLAPLGLFAVVWHWKRHKRFLLAGSILSAWLLGGWFLYKRIVLPSFNPVTRYALTGHFGFETPNLGLFQAIMEHYRSLGWFQLLRTKAIMLLQPFVPIDNAIARISLNHDFGTTALDRFRAWDFLLFSKGNLLAVVFPVITLAGRRTTYQFHSPGRMLILLALCSWLLMTAVFFPPPVIHLWPMAALLGMTFAGASIVQTNYSKLFSLGLGLQLFYTFVVWGISPIKSCRDLDPAALVALIMVGSWAGFRQWGDTRQLSPRASTTNSG